MSSEEDSLLVLVLDVCPRAWAERKAKVEEARANEEANGGKKWKIDFEELVNVVLVFLNSFLLLHRKNRLAFIAAYPGKNQFLFPSPTEGEEDISGRAEQFAKVDREIVAGLRQLVREGVDGGTVEDGVAVNANSTTQRATANIPSALSCALCFANRVKLESPSTSARILVLQISPDVGSQYIPMMNGIFSAQKLGVPIDACVLSEKHSALLQQAAHLTGGIYHRPEEQRALLQYLLSIFLADPNTRKSLRMPKQQSVDFRPVCFCHKKVTESGYVCSVCLSVFCEFRPVCPTCGSRSKVKPKRKRSLPQQNAA